MGWACITHESSEDAYSVLMANPEGKKSIGRLRYGQKYNIKMNLREIGWGGMDWINLAQDRNKWKGLANTAINLGFQRMSGNS
jgi:hypothetical protein